jgi:O-acetyl-ADP-ribose deacetylase (regulator of RNase III)
MSIKPTAFGDPRPSGREILSRIQLLQGDITALEVDAIVNAANNDLILGGGVAGAIRAKGGPAIQQECNKIGTIRVGEAAVTSAGTLKAKYVIHAASMSLGSDTTAGTLRNSVRNTLIKTEQYKITSIAFPAIGTGVAGFPIAGCARIMLDEVISYLGNKPHLTKVYFVLYDKITLQVFKEELDDMSKAYNQ